MVQNANWKLVDFNLHFWWHFNKCLQTEKIGDEGNTRSGKCHEVIINTFLAHEIRSFLSL